MILQKLMNNLVGDRAGIIRSIQRERIYEKPIPLYTYIASRKTLYDKNLEISSLFLSEGLGYSSYSKEEAALSSIGELIERYSCMFMGDYEFINGTYNELIEKYNVLDPHLITRNTDEQIDKHSLVYKKTSRSTKFSWVLTKDLLNNNDIYIPTGIAFINTFYPEDIRERVSTGLAAGSFYEQALEGAILECIERDAVVIMWLNKLSMPIVDNKTIKEKEIQDLINKCESIGLEVVILDISLDINIPIYFVILRNKFNKIPFISTGAKAHYNNKKALLGAIEEAAIGFNINCYQHLSKLLRVNDFSDLSKITFHDHLAYYALGNRLNELEFLYKGEIIGFKELEKTKITSFEDLLSLLKKRELSVCILEHTTPDIKKLGLHVIRAIMPELAFLEQSFPMLKCKRLTEIPQKLNKKAALNFNEAPHPFP